MAPAHRLRELANRRVGLMALLGFSSGLPLLLTGGTLQAWLTEAGLDVETIGWLSLVGVPYTWKFLWSPLMDRFAPPFLGRRRGWMLLTQAALAAGLVAMSLASPAHALPALAALAVLVAFASASQDIVFDAYRTDVLREHERGMGAALSVMGYRVAMLASGAGALLLADRAGFPATYAAMAALMGVGVVATLAGPRPEVPAPAPRRLQDAVVEPFREFFARDGAVALLLLIVLYKLGDAFASSLTTTFLLRGPGFTLSELAVANKVVGLAALLVGAVAGGALMARLGLYRSLMVFGVLQAVTNLGFLALAEAGRSYALLVVVVILENAAGGMGTAAFVAFLMALCDHRYTATQFALLSALGATGRVFVGPAAGHLVAALGWSPFFLVTTVAALPGLALLAALRPVVARLDGPPPDPPAAA